jgi:thiol-disulfide isomerase/thioredoxin
MKYLFFLASLAIAFVSCQSGQSVEEQVSNDVTISGIIENASGGEFHVYGSNELQVDAAVNDSGLFFMTFEIDEPANFTIKYGGERATIFLSPGDSLSLTLDTEMFDETLAFIGRGADYSNYLCGLYLLNEGMDTKNPWATRYLKPAEEYRMVVDSMTEVRQQYLQTAASTKTLSEAFVNVQEQSFLYQRASQLYDYELGAKHYGEVEEVEVPEDFYSFEGELPLENAALIHNGVYNRYVDIVISKMASALYDSIPEDDRTDLDFSGFKIDCIDELLSDQDLKNKFLHEAMQRTLSQYGEQDVSVILEKFTKCCSDQKCIDEITSEVDSWKSLWKGNEAPGFAYNDIEGNTVSLSDLKGKVVYVDVWATWCGPCKREIPHLIELEEAMHEENVAFVSVSIDEDAEAWRTMVTEDQLGGIQIHAVEAWESDICDNYKINGIPRFILIDQNGVIVSAKAPRPSSGEEIIGLINECLEVENEATALN